MSSQSTTSVVQTPLGPMEVETHCPYCNRPLKTTSVTVLGKTYDGLPCFGSCGCEKSQGYVTGTELTSERKKCPECGYMVPVDTDGVCTCSCGYTFVAKSAVDARNASLRASREEEMAESMGGLMAAAGIPELYRDVEPDMELASSIASSGKGLFFTGGSGTFKTVKAASVARAFLDMGRSVRYVKSVDLVSRFRDSIGGEESEAAILRDLRMADLLVIDDLGKEQDTDWTVSTLFRVIDARYADKRPLLITSNYRRGELMAAFSAKGDQRTARAIGSRLAEMTDTVDFGNEDNRLKR